MRNDDDDDGDDGDDGDDDCTHENLWCGDESARATVKVGGGIQKKRRCRME